MTSPKRMSMKEARQTDTSERDKAGPSLPAVYAVYRTDIESEEKLRFPEETNVSSANAVYHKPLLAYDREFKKMRRRRRGQRRLKNDLIFNPRIS